MAPFQTQITCPQCSAQPLIEFDTWTQQEGVYCLRCGYACDSSNAAFKPSWGAYAQKLAGSRRAGPPASNDPVFLADLCDWLLATPDLRTAVVRFPPLYRRVFVCGQPEGIMGLSELQVHLLNTHLDAHGERIVATGPGRLYTANASVPGFKVFAFHADADGLHVSLPDDARPALTIRGDQVTVPDPEVWMLTVVFA